MKKSFLIFLFVFLFSGLFAKEFITDWKGRTLGGKSKPGWVINLFEKGKEKKFRTEFDLKDEVLYFATGKAATKEQALLEASRNIRSEYAREKRIEARQDGTETEEIIYPTGKRNVTVQEIHGLLKVTDFWQKIENDDGDVYFLAWCVYQVEDNSEEITE